MNPFAVLYFFVLKVLLGLFVYAFNRDREIAWCLLCTAAVYSIVMAYIFSDQLSKQQ